VNLVASTLMKAHGEARQSRAISVCDPGGPIMRMFFGVISVASGSSTCGRRIGCAGRWRRGALARGLTDDMFVEFGDDLGRGHLLMSVEGFDEMVLIGVDAQVAGDGQGFLTISAGGSSVFSSRPRAGGLGIGAAAADGDYAQLGLQHIAVAGA